MTTSAAVFSELTTAVPPPSGTSLPLPPPTVVKSVFDQSAFGAARRTSPPPTMKLPVKPVPWVLMINVPPSVRRRVALATPAALEIVPFSVSVVPP